MRVKGNEQLRFNRKKYRRGREEKRGFTTVKERRGREKEREMVRE